VNLYLKFLCGFSQKLQKFYVVIGLIINWSLLIAPGQDMIEGVWVVDAQRSCHRGDNSLLRSNCQIKYDI